MQKSQVFLTAFLVALVVLGQGCKTTMVGPQGKTEAEYSLGGLKSEMPQDLTAVYNAAVKAVKDLELNISTENKDAMSAVIITRDSQDKKVTIKLLATLDGTTKLSIRVGTLGSEAKSRLIYKKITDNL